ncbi:MAG: hypothetical protein RLZZ510_1674, partial [Bacteroidota bacterium]
FALNEAAIKQNFGAKTACDQMFGARDALCSSVACVSGML